MAGKLCTEGTCFQILVRISSSRPLSRCPLRPISSKPKPLLQSFICWNTTLWKMQSAFITMFRKDFRVQCSQILFVKRKRFSRSLAQIVGSQTSISVLQVQRSVVPSAARRKLAAEENLAPMHGSPICVARPTRSIGRKIYLLHRELSSASSRADSEGLINVNSGQTGISFSYTDSTEKETEFFSVFHGRSPSKSACTLDCPSRTGWLRARVLSVYPARSITNAR